MILLHRFLIHKLRSYILTPDGYSGRLCDLLRVSTILLQCKSVHKYEFMRVNKIYVKSIFQ
jgi:hypothetical protein